MTTKERKKGRGLQAFMAILALWLIAYFIAHLVIVSIWGPDAASGIRTVFMGGAITGIVIANVHEIILNW